MYLLLNLAYYTLIMMGISEFILEQTLVHLNIKRAYILPRIGPLATWLQLAFQST